MPVPMCSSSLMGGPVSVSRARAVRRSQRSPSSNSPAQMRVPARFTSAGVMTGSAPQPCCSARAIASRHRRRVVAKGSIFDAKASSARQATSRYGRPILRARSAPSCRCRWLSWFPSDHASTVPRFMSATARRSLSSAMSSSDCAVIGEARNLTCSTTPARWPRLRASDSLSAAAATSRRCLRSGGVDVIEASATVRWAAASSRRPRARSLVARARGRSGPSVTAPGGKARSSVRMV